MTSMSPLSPLIACHLCFTLLDLVIPKNNIEIFITKFNHSLGFANSKSLSQIRLSWIFGWFTGGLHRILPKRWTLRLFVQKVNALETLQCLLLKLKKSIFFPSKRDNWLLRWYIHVPLIIFFWIPPKNPARGPCFLKKLCCDAQFTRYRDCIKLALEVRLHTIPADSKHMGHCTRFSGTRGK